WHQPDGRPHQQIIPLERKPESRADRPGVQPVRARQPDIPGRLRVAGKCPIELVRQDPDEPAAPAGGTGGTSGLLAERPAKKGDVLPPSTPSTPRIHRILSRRSRRLTVSSQASTVSPRERSGGGISEQTALRL